MLVSAEDAGHKRKVRRESKVESAAHQVLDAAKLQVYGRQFPVCVSQQLKVARVYTEALLSDNAAIAVPCRLCTAYTS